MPRSATVFFPVGTLLGSRFGADAAEPVMFHRVRYASMAPAAPATVRPGDVFRERAEQCRDVFGSAVAGGLAEPVLVSPDMPAVGTRS